MKHQWMTTIKEKIEFIMALLLLFLKLFLLFLKFT